jgi:predicted CoA-binding protein
MTRSRAEILTGVPTHSTPATIAALLRSTRTWALVGCSPDHGRACNRIARFLQGHGFRVIPVNPRFTDLLGERCYPRVTDIPPEEGVEVVDIFRPRRPGRQPRR